MANQVLEPIDEQESTIIKEIPDDNRRILRDEIGLLTVRERRLMGLLNDLVGSPDMITAVVKSGGTPIDLTLRTHAELTDISAQKLRAVILLHLMDTGMDSLDIEQWRTILGNSKDE